MKRIVTIIAIAALAMTALAGVGVWQVNRFMASPVSVPNDGALFQIAPGNSFASVTRQLVTEGIIENDYWFRWYARWTGEASGIQAGEYLIEAGATPRTLLEQFTRGSVQLYSFTIVEGWNQRDLLQALHAHDAIVASMTDEDWPALLEELGAPVMHPEGLFLPETYRFPRDTTDRQLLSQAYTLMQEVLDEEWQARGEDAPVSTPYEALVLASIVEKETARADERPRIAGVFARRLAKGMRLQTDPTVIYGIGPGFDGNLTALPLQHLKAFAENPICH